MVEFCNAAGTPNYVPGSPSIDIALLIKKGIDNAARNGNADFGVHVTLTYNSVNNDIQILDSGRKSIKTDTVLLGQVDNRTDLIKLTLAFGALPLPGNNPSFTVTVQSLHKDAMSGTDIELGSPEQFP